MADEFIFTLDSPITEEQWDMLEDVDFDYTNEITFHTKHGKEVKFVKVSVQPEINPIEYRDCANAMLKMWMDNVVTDGEYNRIMDKLNAHWGMKNGRINQQTGCD